MTTPLASRADAGLRPPRRTTAMDGETITLHHGGPSPWGPGPDRTTLTAFRLTTNHDRCASIWRAWQSYHMDAKGWNDVAYNSAVCPHGVRFEGRGVGVRSGAQGTNRGNATSYAVVYVAGSGDPLTEEGQLAYLDEQDRYGVPLRYPHHFWHPTECPGEVDWWIESGFARPGGIVVPSPGPIVLPPTAGTGAPPYPGLLREGMFDNPRVAEVQLRLIHHGHGAQLRVDGDFGRITGDRVRDFQAERGLRPDRLVGPRTWVAVWS